MLGFSELYRDDLIPEYANQLRWLYEEIQSVHEEPGKPL